MKKRRTDRRKENRDIEFPIRNEAGLYVGADRRSGLDRRNQEIDSIAMNILSYIK